MRFYGKVSLRFGGLYEAVGGGWFSPSTFALSWRILVCMKGFVKKQAFAAALFVFSVTAVFCLLSFLPDVPAKSPEKHYGGVVELWNVETFEGGSGSRTAWLTRQAAAFEREHEGLFVHVTTLSAEQAAQKLKEGERFDVLCFSGSGENYLPLLRQVNAAVRSNVEASGTVGGVQYALPLYCGIYALFARQSQISPNAAAADALGFSYTVRTGKHQYVLQPVVCGFTPYNSPLSALAAAGAKGNFAPNYSVTQYAAYQAFVEGKTAVALLGTQRDLYRLSQRERQGRIESLAFFPLCGYTDLVQYLSVHADAPACCDCFAEFMVSEKVQQSLADISLFSVLDEAIYTDQRYAEAEKLLKNAYVPNVFFPSSLREEALKELSS